MCICIYICLCTCRCVYIYICLYVNVFIHSHVFFPCLPFSLIFRSDWGTTMKTRRFCSFYAIQPLFVYVSINISTWTFIFQLLTNFFVSLFYSLFAFFLFLFCVFYFNLGLFKFNKPLIFQAFNSFLCFVFIAK